MLLPPESGAAADDPDTGGGADGVTENRVEAGTEEPCRMTRSDTGLSAAPRRPRRSSRSGRPEMLTALADGRLRPGDLTAEELTRLREATDNPRLRSP